MTKDEAEKMVDAFGKPCLASCGGQYIGAEIISARAALIERLTATPDTGYSAVALHSRKCAKLNYMGADCDCDCGAT